MALCAKSVCIRLTCLTHHSFDLIPRLYWLLRASPQNQSPRRCCSNLVRHDGEVPRPPTQVLQLPSILLYRTASPGAYTADLSEFAGALAARGIVTTQDLREKLGVSDMRQLGVKMGCVLPSRRLATSRFVRHKAAPAAGRAIASSSGKRAPPPRKVRQRRLQPVPHKNQRRKSPRASSSGRC